MVVIRDGEPEINVVIVIYNLNGRSLVIRTRPGTSVVLLEEDYFSVAG